MKKWKNRLRRISLFVLMVITTSGISSFAADGVSTTWYQNNSEILYSNDIVSSAVRYLGWGVVRILSFLADICGKLYDKTFCFLDITKYEKINSLITSLMPILKAFFILSLIFLGVTLMLDKQKKPIVRNIILAMIVVSGSLYGFTTLNNMAAGFKNEILGKNSMEQSYEIVDTNIIDLVRIDKKGSIENLNYSKGTGVIYGAGIKNKKTFSEIKFNETLDYAHADQGKKLYDWSDAFNDKMSYGIIKTDSKYNSYKLPNGFLTTTIGNQFYYRYSFDFIACYLQLIAFLIMIIALSYKNVRIAYELVVARILGVMHAADITSGERLKSILLFIRDTYILLAISILSVKLYTFMDAFINDQGITGVMKGLISVFCAYCVIDGPNIAQRLLGMDAGLGHSVARALGMYELARGAAHGIKHGVDKLQGGNDNSKSSGVVPSNKKSSTSSTKANSAIDTMNKNDDKKAESGSSGENQNVDANAEKSAEKIEPGTNTNAKPETKENTPPTPDNKNSASTAIDTMNASESKSADAPVSIPEADTKAEDAVANMETSSASQTASTSQKETLGATSEKEDITNTKMTVGFMDGTAKTPTQEKIKTVPKKTIKSNSNLASKPPIKETKIVGKEVPKQNISKALDGGKEKNDGNGKKQ